MFAVLKIVLVRPGARDELEDAEEAKMNWTWSTSFGRVTNLSTHQTVFDKHSRSVLLFKTSILPCSYFFTSFAQCYSKHLQAVWRQDIQWITKY